MRLPPAPVSYQFHHQREVQRQVEDLARRAVVAGRDIEVGSARVILTAPNGSRWALSVDNAGALTAVPA